MGIFRNRRTYLNRPEAPFTRRSCYTDMSQRSSTALDDGIDLPRSWTRLNSTVTNRGHRRFVDRYVRSPPELQEWMEEIAAAGPRKRKIMAKVARMAIQQVRKETGRDEHGRLLRHVALRFPPFVVFRSTLSAN